MTAQLDAVIVNFFNFRDYYEIPTLQELPLEKQLEATSTYLAENISELHEMLAYVDERVVVDVVQIISGSTDTDSNCRQELDDALRNASIAAFTFAINDRIESLYETFVREFGVFAPDSMHEPSELIGWKE